MRCLLFIPVILALLCSAPGCQSTPGIDYADIAWRENKDSSNQAQAYAHYLSAIVYEKTGQKDAALREMEKTAQKDPEAETPNLRLIRSYLQAKDYDKALVCTERAIKKRPESAHLWVVLGETYHNLNDYDKATDAFLKAIEINPDNVLGYGALLQLQENTNDLVAAIEIYERILAIKPNNAGLHYQLGLTLARINDTENAKKHLEQALGLNPKLTHARYLLGVIDFEQDRIPQSMAWFQGYLKRRPKHGEAIEYLSACYARQGDYSRALPLMHALANSQYGAAKHHIALMYLAIQNHQAEKAESYRPAIDAPLFGVLFTALARKAQDMPYQSLLDSLDTVEGDWELECDEIINHLFYSFDQEVLGPWLLERILAFREESDSRVLGLMHARTLGSMDRFKDSIPVYEALLKGDASDKGLHYHLAVAYEELGDIQGVEKNLLAYLEYHPDDSDVLNFLGYFYAENNMKLKKAEALLNKALSLDPDNPFYLDSLGWIYYRKGLAGKAIDFIQRAIYGMENDDAVLRDHLGDAWLLKGDVDRALAEWERALRLDSEVEGVQEKIDKYSR